MKSEVFVFSFAAPSPLTGYYIPHAKVKISLHNCHITNLLICIHLFGSEQKLQVYTENILFRSYASGAQFF